MYFIFPYKKGSKSAKTLKSAIGSKYPVTASKQFKKMINWGASEVPFNYRYILNKPDAVRIASNKLLSFNTMKEAGVSIPEFTTNKEEAENWLESSDVVCRFKLNGHSGEGITIVNKGEQLPEEVAPLYTRYVKKKKEYRVHVFKGEVIFVQEKKKRNSIPTEEMDFRIRNASGGFVFAHQDVFLGEGGRDVACAAVNALGLDFGAVDLIYNERQDKFYALEVNTAPGLEGETVNRYKEAFLKYERELNG